MYVLLCIDDTDSMDSRGTGELAEIIANNIKKNGWGICYPVTRHQLLLHEDIPYTSHNSSMCFALETDLKFLQGIINHASEFLKLESEPESDPGLCVVAVDCVKDKDKFLHFGMRAKREVLSKEKAYALAEELGVHLSEHGGTGQGIIGALAGASLRFGGNDGWLKGSLKVEAPDNVIKVSEACMHENIDKVRTLSGEYLDDDEEIELDKLVKPVLIEGKFVLLVEETNEEDAIVRWKVCSKKGLKKYEAMTTCGL
jgi:hypothetical protein